MKKLKTYLSFTFLLAMTAIGVAQGTQETVNKKENVLIEITRNTSKLAIDELITKLKLNGIDLTISELNYNAFGKIKKIKGKIDCNDGFSGSFSGKRIFKKLIIQRNYNSDAVKRFSIDVN